MLGMTFLGGRYFLGPLCLALVCTLWWRNHEKEAYLLAGLSLATGLLEVLLKNLFQRPRPELWERLAHASGYSFPSGHALASTTICGALAYLLRERYPQKKRLIYGFALVWILLSGLTRLYLGVHWPTDVLGSWILGSVLLLSSLQFYRKPAL